jgi:hypothetical protein
VLAGTVASTGALLRQGQKILTGSASGIGNLSRAGIFRVVLAGVLAFHRALVLDGVSDVIRKLYKLFFARSGRVIDVSASRNVYHFSGSSGLLINLPASFQDDGLLQGE